MLEKVSVFFICAAFVGATLHWRFFDGAAVVMLLGMFFFARSSKLIVAEIWGHGKTINSLLLAWVLAIFIGDILSGTPIEVLNFRWIIGAYIIYIYTRAIHVRDNSQLSLLSTILSIGTVAAIIYNYKTSGESPSYENRFQGFYSNPNVYGMALSLAFAFLFSWIQTAVYFKKAISYFDLFALLTMGATIYLTYSRSSWGGIMTAAVVGGFILRSNRKIVLTYLSLAIAFAVMYISNFLHLKDRLLYTLNFSGTTASTARFEIWKANIAMFLDHPVFGVGYWHNTQLLEKYAPGKVFYDDIHAHAHNQYLQVLSGAGIAGFIIYISILLVIGIYFYRQFRSSSDVVVRRFALCAFLTLISYLITSLTDSPLDSRETRDFLMLILAGSLGIIHSRALKTSEVKLNS